jgi:hypothetical protein
VPAQTNVSSYYCHQTNPHKGLKSFSMRKAPDPRIYFVQLRRIRRVNGFDHFQYRFSAILVNDCKLLARVDRLLLAGRHARVGVGSRASEGIMLGIIGLSPETALRPAADPAADR